MLLGLETLALFAGAVTTVITIATATTTKRPQITGKMTFSGLLLATVLFFFLLIFYHSPCLVYNVVSITLLSYQKMKKKTNNLTIKYQFFFSFLTLT